MATKSIMICDQCEKKEKKDTTGWLAVSLNIDMYGKEGFWWSRERKKKRDEYNVYKQFCSLECMNIWFDTLVVTGTLSRKVKRLLKIQRKEIGK